MTYKFVIINFQVHLVWYIHVQLKTLLRINEMYKEKEFFIQQQQQQQNLTGKKLTLVSRVHEKALLTLQEVWWVQHCHTNLDNHSSLPLQILHSLSCFKDQKQTYFYIKEIQ